MRLLLVEDNPIDAQAVADMLQERPDAGFQLSHVQSLAEMSQLWKQETDVIVLDLTLPDGQGLVTVSRAQGTFPNTPIVVMTADDDEERALEMVRGGAQDYLIKGRFDATSLVRALLYAVERCRADELRQRLVRADRLAVVGQLASGVAHEITNPASFVLGNLVLMQRHLDRLQACFQELGKAADTGNAVAILETVEHVVSDANLERALEDVGRINTENVSGMDRICSVARDLQHYSRIDRNEVESVSLNELVEATCKLVNNLTRHRAELVKVLGTVPNLNAHRGRIEQIVTNLLVNAAQAIPEGAPQDNRITIKTELTTEGVMLIVEDTGYGVPESLRDRIFEPFFTTKARGVGTGLGLSIAADIARKHGGVLRCTSEQGAGTRFELVLPEDTGLSLPQPQSRRPTPMPGSERRGRVLLIDDEPAICSVYKEFLGDTHDVAVALSGREAVERLTEQGEYEAVLCDLMMPDMDGPQIYEWMEKNAPHMLTRVIFCTGGLVTERSREFMRRVPNRLLEKPVPIGDLLKALEQVIEETRSSV